MPAQISKIDRKFQKLEQKRKDLIHIISSIPEEAYYKSPKPGSWSIAQVANHLYLSETLSLTYLRKKISYPDSIPSFHIVSYASLLALKFSFYSPVKFKAPPAIDMWSEQTILSQKDLIEKWSKTRQGLIDFIHTHHDQFHSNLVYKHPIAGRLTLYQMLIFMNDHMNRHVKQIRRIVSEID